MTYNQFLEVQVVWAGAVVILALLATWVALRIWGR